MGILIGLAAMTGAYLFAVKPSGRKDWMKRYQPFYFAHRGLYDNESDAPENSMKAFQNAIEHGYGMEMDVQLSKDDIPVIFHDTWMDRVARDSNHDPVSGKIHDYTLKQLKSFHLLESNETIPTLAEFLALVNGQVPLIVELKTDNETDVNKLCTKTDELLSAYKGMYVVESFHPMAVYWYKKHRPEIIRGQLSEAFTKTKQYRHLHYLCSEYLLFNGVTKPDFIAYNSKHESNLSRRLARKLFQVPSVAWTIQSDAELQHMKDKYDLFIFESFKPEETPRR